MAGQPKYLMVAETLRREIAEGVFQDGDKLMTEETMRMRFDVSRQTVRQAIALLEEDGLVDRQRGSGTYVRHGRRKQIGKLQIGVVTTYITDYIFPDIVRGMEEVLSRGDAVMTLSATYNSPEAERRILERMTEGQVDGVIVEGVRTARPTANGDCFLRLAERNIPVLQINGYYRELQGVPYVAMDDAGGGRMAAAEIVRRGYRRPAALFKTDDLQGLERFRGLREALAEAGTEMPEERILCFDTERRMDLYETRAGRDFADMLAAGRADCVVCYNDVFAVNLIGRLEQRGVRMPEDLGVISFDNSSFATVTRPQLTTLNHPREKLGALAAEKMLRMIDGRKEDSVCLPWELVERASLPDRGQA